MMPVHADGGRLQAVRGIGQEHVNQGANRLPFILWLLFCWSVSHDTVPRLHCCLAVRLPAHTERNLPSIDLHIPSVLSLTEPRTFADSPHGLHPGHAVDWVPFRCPFTEGEVANS